MDYKQLKEVNETLATMDIKGKAYVQVNTRVMAFRQLFPEGTIETELVDNSNGVCTIKATIKNEDGKVLATGHANEKESSSYINKTSYIENCETSAVGRALAMLGVGIDGSMCSAEELVNAVTNQTQCVSTSQYAKVDDKHVQILEKKISEIVDERVRTFFVTEMLKKYKAKTLADLTVATFTGLIKDWDSYVKWAEGRVGGA